MDFAGIQMDDMWMDNSAPDDQRHIGLESLLDHSNGPGGPVVPDVPYTPLLRGSGNAEAHDTYAEIAALPPYEGMERLCVEQEILAETEWEIASELGRRSALRSIEERGGLLSDTRFSNAMEQNEPPGYEYPQYGVMQGGLP